MCVRSCDASRTWVYFCTCLSQFGGTLSEGGGGGAAVAGGLRHLAQPVRPCQIRDFPGLVPPSLPVQSAPLLLPIAPFSSAGLLELSRLHPPPWSERTDVPSQRVSTFPFLPRRRLKAASQFPLLHSVARLGESLL